MFLDLHQHEYAKDIVPFIKNGIIIDTSVIDIFIEGLIQTRISKKRVEELSEYTSLLNFLDLIKVTNRFDKFYITPHILTEVCTHLRNAHSKRLDYSKLVTEVMPILKGMNEQAVEKNAILGRIDFAKPVVEIGDISIFIVTEFFLESGKKIAILAKDRELNRIYADDPNVLVMDYYSTILNNL